MKKIYFVFVSIMLLSSVSFKAQQVGPKEELMWYTDIAKAAEISNATNKPIFAFFTGSDWCGWCRKLQVNVFSKKEFIRWAHQNVVLVELDFPRGKQLSPELQQQNSSLQQTFGVQGYPTVWLFFMSPQTGGVGYTINALGSTGYPGGAEPGREEVKFISDANAIIVNKATK